VSPFYVQVCADNNLGKMKNMSLCKNDTCLIEVCTEKQVEVLLTASLLSFHTGERGGSDSSRIDSSRRGSIAL
jgi:hypothetical protein